MCVCVRKGRRGDFHEMRRRDPKGLDDEIHGT